MNISKGNINEYEQLTDRDHILKRPEMYMGAIGITSAERLIIQNTDNLITMNFCQASHSLGWMKIIDEILVNALDQWQIRRTSGDVNIRVKFNKRTGRISIWNSGPGFDIYKTKSLQTGKQIYTPELLTTQARSGSNFGEKNNTTGGLNGYGSILTNIFSTEFIIETVNDSIYYRQRMSQNMHPDKIECPTVIIKESDLWKKLSFEEKTPHTNITFMPDYRKFGYASEIPSTGELIMLYNLVKTRLYFASAYMEGHNSVHLNNKLINCTGIFDLAKCIIESNQFKCTNISKPKYPWKIAVGLSDGVFRGISVMNGIIVPEGNHINYIRDCVVKSFNIHAEKMIDKYTCSLKQINTLIRLHLYIIIVGDIPKDQFEWNSQTKEKLTCHVSVLNKYKLCKDFLDNIWKIIKDELESSFHLFQTKKICSMKYKQDPRNYDRAHHCMDKNKWKMCSLFVVEGESARTTARRGINSKTSKLSSDYYGIISIQGVPINARKETNVKIRKGEQKFLYTRKLLNNNKWNAFMAAAGLEYGHKYEYFTEEERKLCGKCDDDNRCKICICALDKQMRFQVGNEEFSKLHYGRIIGLVDADEDGQGQIWGLLLNDIALFWKYLFKRNWIMRFNTPVVRVYIKKKIVHEFYTMAEYDKWIEKEKISDDITNIQEELSSKYNIKYYKGLASHTPYETKNMFITFEHCLFLYYFDEHANQMFEIYYGKNTDARKKELSRDMIPTTKSTKTFAILCGDMRKRNRGSDFTLQGLAISCTEQLQNDVWPFQITSLIRHTPHLMDGLTPASRKTLHIAKRTFNQRNKEVKVYQLCGKVASEANYHHGDKSLNGVIIHMAQSFPGAHILPLLNGIGEFGSRSKGGQDAGCERYISVNLNKKLCNTIYPSEDNWLLHYVFEDGLRSEPKFYVPIIPMILVEDQKTLGTGWKTTIYARDLFTIILRTERVIQLLQKNPVADIFKLKSRIFASTHGYGPKSVITEFEKGIPIEYSVGSYQLEGDSICISELPRRRWTDIYIHGSVAVRCSQCENTSKMCAQCDEIYEKKKSSGMKYHSMIEILIDKSEDDDVDIRIILKNGSFDIITRNYMKKININLQRIEKEKKKVEKIAAKLRDLEGNFEDKLVPESKCKAEFHVSDKEKHDAIMNYFNLKKKMTPNLNLIVTGLEGNIIKQFESYPEIFNAWFVVRKKYYEMRLKRRIILLEHINPMLENILKFIHNIHLYELNSREKSNMSMEKQILKLQEEGFPMFNQKLLENPRYIPISELNERLAEGASYNYLLKLNSLNMNASGIKSYEQQLKSYKMELQVLLEENLEFLGSNIWLQELKQLKNIINQGFKEGWVN